MYACTGAAAWTLHPALVDFVADAFKLNFKVRGWSICLHTEAHAIHCNAHSSSRTLHGGLENAKPFCVHATGQHGDALSEQLLQR